jgi:hypothetical protein
MATKSTLTALISPPDFRRLEINIRGTTPHAAMRARE